ncbi:MAG: hypothetical protein KAW41_01955 [Candidatus Diapherotrites archaeon]|nr:hypothetical protein [Candidatus Diapherotrites archaeon]
MELKPSEAHSQNKIGEMRKIKSHVMELFQPFKPELGGWIFKNRGIDPYAQLLRHHERLQNKLKYAEAELSGQFEKMGGTGGTTEEWKEVHATLVELKKTAEKTLNGIRNNVVEAKSVDLEEYGPEPEPTAEERRRMKLIELEEFRQHQKELIESIRAKHDVWDNTLDYLEKYPLNVLTFLDDKLMDEIKSKTAPSQ